MAKPKFDKVACKYCGQKIDKRGIKRHEDNCSENPANKEGDNDIVNEEEIDVEEEEIEEEVEEDKDEVEIKDDEVSTNGEPLVDILPNQDAKLYYGCKWYYLEKGKKMKVVKGFKDVLVKANMLNPL